MTGGAIDLFAKGKLWLDGRRLSVTSSFYLVKVVVVDHLSMLVNNILTPNDKREPSHSALI